MASWLFVCCFVLLGSAQYVSASSTTDPAKRLLDRFGSNGTMTEKQTEELFHKMGLEDWDHDHYDEEHCSSSKYFHQTYSKNGKLGKEELTGFCPAVLYELAKPACQRKADDHHHHHDEDGNEDEGKAWGFGILFVTVISLGSLLGAFMVPFMQKKVFQTILMAMISLAVGVLSGSAIFHLIPHALDLGHDDLGYMWKLVMVAVGIYIFFLLEVVMKMYLHYKEFSWDLNTNVVGDNHLAKTNLGHYHEHGHSHFLSKEPNALSHEPNKPPAIVDKKVNDTDLSSLTPPKEKIATVAWMIIIGDGLHNFIDGLAIGASCSSSVLSGLSTSLAICCEELPHELGDFAILLKSGMSYKQAMLANFGSACLCYLGLIVGIILGFNTSGVHYIYGLAGGMFLYIALVDMLPESIEMIKELCGNSRLNGLKMLLVQSFFIFIGFVAMLVLSFYAHEIKHAEL